MISDTEYREQKLESAKRRVMDGDINRVTNLDLMIVLKDLYEEINNLRDDLTNLERLTGNCSQDGWDE